MQFVSSHAIDYFGKPAPVSVIVAMAPIFVYIIAYFVLREKIGLIPILNVFVAVAGVIVMNLNDLMGNRPNSRALVSLSRTVRYKLIAWLCLDFLIVGIFRRGLVLPLQPCF